MTGGDRHRCRWHEDSHGRCPDSAAFPGVQDVPELCCRHLARLDAWVAARAKAGGATADAWITWAARHAAGAQETLKALGVIRPARALEDGRPVWPAGPERR